MTLASLAPRAAVAAFLCAGALGGLAAVDAPASTATPASASAPATSCAYYHRKAVEYRERAYDDQKEVRDADKAGQKAAARRAAKREAKDQATSDAYEKKYQRCRSH